MTHSTFRRRLKPLVKAAIIAVVAWFVHGSLIGGWEKLQEKIASGDWSAAQVRRSWLIAATVFYSLGQLPFGVFWLQVLRALGQRPSPAAVVRAFYVGHLGKYVPGKAMVVVMRSGMLVEEGVRPAAAAVSVFYETLTMMAVGALISAAIIAAKFRAHVDWLAASIAMLVVTGLPIVPAVFTRVVRRLGVGGPSDSAAATDVGRIGLGRLMQGWAIVAVGWVLMGLSIWATLHGAGFSAEENLLDQWIVCTAAGALSVVVGFLSFIPGGFFVREAVLLVFLQPTYGEAAALVGAVLVRLVWLVAELLVSVILYVWGRRGRS